MSCHVLLYFLNMRLWIFYRFVCHGVHKESPVRNSRWDFWPQWSRTFCHTIIIRIWFWYFIPQPYYFKKLFFKLYYYCIGSSINTRLLVVLIPFQYWYLHHGFVIIIIENVSILVERCGTVLEILIDYAMEMGEASKTNAISLACLDNLRFYFPMRLRLFTWLEVPFCMVKN